jgi:hypothetical protein
VSRYLSLATSLVLCLSASLEAQMVPTNLHRNTIGGRQQSGVQSVEVPGTIQGVKRGGIVILNANNQPISVAMVSPTKISVGTKIQVTGSVRASDLRSGLTVELNAEIDNRGRIQGKVDSLTITTVTRDRPLGIFPESDGFAGNGVTDADKTSKRSSHGKSSRAQIIGRCRIIGHLVVGRDGALSVQPGRSTLPFELGEQAKISVNMADFSLVRRGMEVTVRGIANVRQPNMVQATEVTIKLPELPDVAPPENADKPEKTVKRQPSAKSPAKKSGKASKKGKDEGLPEPAEEPADK